MGAGYAQVGLLLLLTVVGLPLFFFGLMAALDRFERAISPRPAVPATANSPEPAAEAAPDIAATVVSLPVASASIAGATLAASGGAAAVATGKSAAAI